MDGFKDALGNILFVLGLIVCVVSILAWFGLVDELDVMAFAVSFVGIIQGFLISGIGVICNHLKEIRDKPVPTLQVPSAQISIVEQKKNTITYSDDLPNI